MPTSIFKNIHFPQSFKIIPAIFSFITDMRIKILIIILWFAIIPYASVAQSELNQSDASGLKQGLWRKTYPNGRTLYEGRFVDDKPAGEWRRYHDNGKLRALLQYNTQSDSAWAKMYDVTGKLTAEGLYMDEKKEGVWTYFSDGKKISEDNYKKGAKEGVSHTFYATGEILEEILWENNMRNGKYSALFTNGKPFMECIYKNDKRNGLCVSYFENGKIELEAFYQNDLPEKEWKFFDPKGELLYTLQYSEGLLQNPEVLYEIETRKLNEMERQGKNLDDPAKYFDDPSQILLKNR